MRIITFITTDETVPEPLRAVAHLLDGADYLPIRITTSTEEKARAKAQEFWDSEKSKYLRPAPKTAPLRVKAAPAVDFDDLLGGG